MSEVTAVSPISARLRWLIFLAIMVGYRAYGTYGDFEAFQSLNTPEAWAQSMGLSPIPEAAVPVLVTLAGMAPLFSYLALGLTALGAIALLLGLLGRNIALLLATLVLTGQTLLVISVPAIINYQCGGALLDSLEPETLAFAAFTLAWAAASTMMWKARWLDDPFEDRQPPAEPDVPALPS